MDNTLETFSIRYVDGIETLVLWGDGDCVVLDGVDFYFYPVWGHA